MPLITTHYYFSCDVLKATPQKLADKLNKDNKTYHLFAQGFDPLYFYDFFNFGRTSYQKYCHTNHTDDYFITLIKNIKIQKLENNEKINSALYGALTHYILDSKIHPYVVYKTGFYNKTIKETKKYQGLHSKMEMQIDAYLYEEKNKLPFKNFKIHKNLISIDLNKDLINILNKTFEEVFSIKNGGKKYKKGCYEMYYTYKFLIEDESGFKTKIYKILDKIIPSKLGKYETFSSNVKNIDIEIFNLEHKNWQNPWSGEKYNTSFFDLYNEALKECQKLFIATDKYINNEISINEYKKVLKDKSYLTGLSWKDNKEIKYLEF
jgi:hypothetical protein